MQITTPLFLLASALFAGPAALAQDTNEDYIFPDRYIVEYAAPLGSKRSSDAHGHFSTNMRRSGLPFDIKIEFSDSVFTGASILSPDADIVKLKAMPNVLNVWPVKSVVRPQALNGYSLDAAGVSNPTDTFSTHQMTGVDRLHNEGIKGQGIFIAEIDTGVDYTHPALGGCFGKGCKVAYGYDFVGDNYTGSGSEPVPDDDPIDTCDGHGTHVAGILAADNINNLNVTGVAPRATLGAYRVFGCTGTSGTDIIMAAMMRAKNDGADIISLSLGTVGGWTEDATAVVASRLVAGGVIVSASQGNNGAAGGFYPGSPGLGRGVIASASVENIITPSKALEISTGNLGPIQLTGNEVNIINLEKDLGPLPIVVRSDGGCTAYPAGSLIGKVALVKRGEGCVFAPKAQNVLDAGGEIIIIYNNVDGTILPNFLPVAIKGAGITQADGLAIIATLAANPSSTVTFKANYVNFPNNVNPGLINAFTTYGLSFDLFVKPQVAAPGGHILSTYPLSKGAYFVQDGTSMACPFTSGVAALYLQQNGKGSPPALVQAALQNYARPVSTTLNGTTLETIAKQGAGLIDAYSSVHLKTRIVPSEIALNDTDHFVSSTVIKVSNFGTATAAYRLSHLPAGSLNVFGTSGAAVSQQPRTFSTASNTPLALNQAAATVSFSQTYITVAPGATEEVTVTFNAPSGSPAAQIPIYSGVIRVEGPSSNEVLTIPYAGVAASMKNDYGIFDTSSYYFSTTLPTIVKTALNITYLNVQSQVQQGPRSYSFVGTDSPRVLFRLKGGSSKILVDLIKADSAFTPSISRRTHFEANRMHRAVLSRADTTVPTTFGRIREIDYAARSGDSTATGLTLTDWTYIPVTTATSGPWKLADGTTVPNGDYKILVRGLKFFADETQSGDYESWLSPVITVAYPAPP